MTAHLELRSQAGGSTVVLDRDRLTVGREEHNDVPLTGDARASRIHASLERYGVGWCLQDLGSRNGTFVNGERVWRERVLHDGDEILIGAAHIVFRAGRAGAPPALTEAGAGILRLTPREFDVLAALCSPLLAGAMFTEPAPTREIAALLVVTQTAVKQHLGNLYEKFGIDVPHDQRRTRLANEALSRGVLTLADVRSWVTRREQTRAPSRPSAESEPAPA